MARLTLLTIALAFLYALNFVKCETWGDVDGKLELNNIGVGSAATDGKNQVNLTKIVEGTEGTNSVRGIQVSPRFLLQPRIDAAPTTRTTITYKLGQRINGDREVASNSQYQEWNISQNVTQNITYPRSGVGSVVTYVEVVVVQTSNLGRGYVTGGGIGQRQISLTIEAYKTLSFRQNTKVYGY